MKVHLAFLLSTGLVLGAGESFYKRPALFSTRPGETKSLQSIDRFGPVGIGIELIQPAFTMTDQERRGGLARRRDGKAQDRPDHRVDQRPETPGHRPAHPARQHHHEGRGHRRGDQVRDQGRGASRWWSKIPVLGAYSKTWPLDCPKSDKIVRDFADYLTKPDSNKGFGDIGMLFLLSTGEDKDLAAGRRMGAGTTQGSRRPTRGTSASAGSRCANTTCAPATPKVLPTIQKWVDKRSNGQYLDAWAGRGGVPTVTYGDGGAPQRRRHRGASPSCCSPRNAVPTCRTSAARRARPLLPLRRPRQQPLRRRPAGDRLRRQRQERQPRLRHGRGRGADARGRELDLCPRPRHRRDDRASTPPPTCSTATPAAASARSGAAPRWACSHDKRPEQYREFMDNRRWHYELSRRFDGSFGILGGAGYDNVEWGAGYAPGLHRPAQDPAHHRRAADEVLEALPTAEAAMGHRGGRRFPIARGGARQGRQAAGSLRRDAGQGFRQAAHRTVSRPWRRQRRCPAPATSVTRTHVIRQTAAAKVMGINRGYIGWREPGGKVRPELIEECLLSETPASARPMFSAIDTCLEKRPEAGVLTPEVYDNCDRRLSTDRRSLVGQGCRAAGHRAWPADRSPRTSTCCFPTSSTRNGGCRTPRSPPLRRWWPTSGAIARCFPRSANCSAPTSAAALTGGPMGPIRAKITEAASRSAETRRRDARRDLHRIRRGEDRAGRTGHLQSTLTSHLEYIAASLADVPGGMRRAL